MVLSLNIISICKTHITLKCVLHAQAEYNLIQIGESKHLHVPLAFKTTDPSLRVSKLLLGMTLFLVDRGGLHLLKLNYAWF